MHKNFDFTKNTPNSKIISVYINKFEEGSTGEGWDNGFRYLCDDGLILRYLSVSGWQIWAPSILKPRYNGQRTAEWIPCEKEED